MQNETGSKTGEIVNSQHSSKGSKSYSEPLSDQILHWLENKWPLLAVLLGVAVFVGAIWATYDFLKKRENNGVAEKLFPLEQKWNEAFKKENKNFDTDLKPVLDGIQQELKDHVSAPAAQIYAIPLLNQLVEIQQLESAVKTYELFQKVSCCSESQSLLRLVGGQLYADKGDCKQALQEWSKIEGSDYLKTEVNYKSALCHQKLGDKAKAKALFEDIQKAKDNSPLKTQAEQALRLINSENPQ